MSPQIRTCRHNLKVGEGLRGELNYLAMSFSRGTPGKGKVEKKKKLRVPEINETDMALTRAPKERMIRSLS